MHRAWRLSHFPSLTPTTTCFFLTLLDPAIPTPVGYFSRYHFRALLMLYRRTAAYATFVIAFPKYIKKLGQRSGGVIGVDINLLLLHLIEKMSRWRQHEHLPFQRLISRFGFVHRRIWCYSRVIPLLFAHSEIRVFFRTFDASLKLGLIPYFAKWYFTTYSTLMS